MESVTCVTSVTRTNDKKDFQIMVRTLSDLVYLRYKDHVLFNRSSPLIMKPQIREAVGWLNYQCEDYLVLSWDRDTQPPKLKGGDAKASGLVVLKSAVLELIKLQVHELPLQENSECHLNSTQPKGKVEWALPAKEAKNSKKKRKTT